MAKNLFLDAKELLQKNDSLNYINYENINEEQREFLRTDLWDWRFSVPPAAVYYPGDDLIHTRLRAVSPQFTYGMSTTITATIRGFDIQQNVGFKSSGTLTLDFTDREDQCISVFLTDWQEKLTARDTKYTFRKEDTVAEGILTMFNSSRIPIRRYKVLTVQLMDPAPSLSFTSDDPAQNGELSANFTFEHHRLLWENLPS